MTLCCQYLLLQRYSCQTDCWNSDVIGKDSDVDIYVYDRSSQETFLGHVRLEPDLKGGDTTEGWFKLGARSSEEESVSGEIRLEMKFQKTDKKHFGPEDFQILKLIGKGTHYYNLASYDLQS